MIFSIASSCEDSSILTSSIIDVERISSSSMNVTISFGHIPCFYFVIRILYIWRVIISKTKMSNWSWSRNVSHKWYANSNIHGSFDWTGTKSSLLVW